MNNNLKINCAGEVNNASSILISTYIWKIKTFSAKVNDLKMGEKIESPMFFVRANRRKLKFKIRMYPKGREGSNEHVSIYLYSYNDGAVKLEYKFLLRENREFKCTHIFNQNDYGWGEDNFIQISELFKKENGFIVDEKLTILCEFKIDMCCTYNTQPSDVKFIIDDRELYGHKNILAANSTVFAAMFKNDSKKNVFTIEDIEEDDAFNALLQFIYLEDIIFDEFSIIKDIITAAEKYAIEELKSACENKLCEEITVNNVFEYLNFAHIRNLNKLKLKSIEFINIQGRQMISNNQFNSVTSLPQGLIIELFNAVLPQ